MKSILTLVIALALALTAFAQDEIFEINTPSNVDACTNVRITWSAGVAPFDLHITQGADPDSDILVFRNISGRAITWFVNIQSVQTHIGLTIIDATGEKAQSAAFDIGPNDSSNCTLTTTSFSAATAEAAPTGSATTARSSATTTTPSSSKTASGSSVSGASRSSGATSSASTQSAGASRVTGQITAAGIIGAAMVALLG